MKRKDDEGEKDSPAKWTGRGGEMLSKDEGMRKGKRGVFFLWEGAF
jgi:hypothetical protein